MTLRGKILIGLAVAIAATAAVAIVFFSNPLQKSNEALRAYLLQKVPLGSSLENLQAVPRVRVGNSPAPPNLSSLMAHGRPAHESFWGSMNPRKWTRIGNSKIAV